MRISNWKINEDLRIQLSLATWEAFVPTKGCLKSSTGNRGWLMLSRSTEAAPNKGAKSTQHLVSNTVAQPLQVVCDFRQFWGEFKGNCLKGTRHASLSHGDLQPKWFPAICRGLQLLQFQHFCVQRQTSIQPKFFLQKTNRLVGASSH
jgi:hypothetical protein